jgi:hypothetical protein
LLALVYTESVGTRLRWHCRSGAPCGGTWPHSSERWLQQSVLHRLHPMPTFPSRPLNKSPLHLRLKKNPAIFGVPFLLVMVGASFGLQAFTQTRYDLHSQKVTQVRTLDIYSISFVHVHHSFIHPFQMSREQELGLDRSRKKFDAREEYFVSLRSFSPLLCPFPLFFSPCVVNAILNYHLFLKCM